MLRTIGDLLRVPVTVACGELDVPFLIARSRELPGRLRGGRYRQLPGMAHQPYLEEPGQVADLVLGALKGGFVGSGPEHDVTSGTLGVCDVLVRCCLRVPCRGWLTEVRLPGYAPDLNPVEDPGPALEPY